MLHSRSMKRNLIASNIILEQLEERIVLDGAVDDVSSRADQFSAQFVDVDSVADSDASDAVSTGSSLDVESLALETGSETLPDNTWHYWERDWGVDGNGYEFHAWQDGSTSFHQIQWDASANSKGTHNGFDYNLQRDGSWTYQAVLWDASQNGYSYNSTSTGVFTYRAEQWSNGMGYSYASNSSGQWTYHVVENGDSPGDVREFDADSFGYWDFSYTWANGTTWNDGSKNHPYLVKDWGSDDLTAVNGTLYFTYFDSLVYGDELWKSDGSEIGTLMVKDIRPGLDSSDIEGMINVNGTLFFTANDGIHGRELWKSDGTEAGTVLVKDIRPGLDSGDPLRLTNVNGTVYFVAYTPEHAYYELWKSDGTETGTVMVKDLWMEGSSQRPYYLTNVDGKLYFLADDGTYGLELWSSDGTEAGTHMVRDIYPEWKGSDASLLTAVGDTLYFWATDGSGFHLWKSDGSAEGTVMVKRIDANPKPAYLTNMDGMLYFTANGRELWKTDGTESGTQRVKDFVGSPDFNFQKIGQTVPVDGILYLTADDGVHGAELWKSDGTEPGTQLVKDILPGSENSYVGSALSPGKLVGVNGKLFFTTDDGIHGKELWMSDGTEAATVMIQDIRPGSSGSEPNYLTPVNGTLFFTANDGANPFGLWAVRVAKGALS